MRLHHAVVCFACSVLGVAYSLPAFAQSGAATLSGRVTDQSGSAVAAAKVEAVSVTTNAVYPTQTNEAGLYNIPALSPGAYRIIVNKEGFQQIIQSGIELQVADSVAVNFALAIGSVTQSVTVVGSVPLVNTTNSSLGGIVNEDKMADLPLNGRNYSDLTYMQPGVTINSNSGGSTQQGGARGTFFTSDGASIRENIISIDGAIVLNGRGGSASSESGTTLGVAGIKEYKVVTGIFDASYGNEPGAQVVIVSKAGTNQFHGEVFEYLRNDVMDAANFFDKPVAANGFARLPPFKRNNFGAGAGGPIKKNKTFFFAAYEGLRQRLGQTLVETVPGVGCHGPTGNNTGLVTSAACPQLGAGAPSVTIAPVMTPLLALYPVPNLANNQATFPYSSPSDVNWGQIRVDQNISASDSVFGRYTTDKSSLIKSNGFPEFATSFASYDQFATISENHIFSPAVLNQLRFSYSRSTFLESPLFPTTSYSPNGAASLTGPQYTFVAGLPVGSIALSGFSTFGPSASVPSHTNVNAYVLNDDLYYTKGTHALRFGVAINRGNDGVFETISGIGVVNFSNLASFLRGIPLNYVGEQGGPQPNIARNWMWWVPGFYAQDDWRVLPRLTLNLGLRYELLTVPKADGRSYGLPNPKTAPAYIQGPAFAPFSKLHFSPRVGFAWDVQGNGKTSVRGGFGQYFDIGNLAGIFYTGKAAEPPFDGELTHINTTNAALTLPLTFFPKDTIGFQSTDYYLKNPYLLKWNLTVERQLPASMQLQVAYVGTRGVHLYQIVEGNPSLPTAVVNGLPYWNGTEHRQNPNLSSGQITTSGGESTFHALEVAVNKRVTHGVEFQVSYTYSKELDNTQAVTNGDCGSASGMPQGDYFGPGNSVFLRGPACNDLTHNLRFNALYHIPNVNSDNFAARMEHGWWMGIIWSAQTGYAFTPILGTNRSQSQNLAINNVTDYANVATAADAAFCTANPASCKYIPVPFNPSTVIKGSPAQWYNPNMFTLEPMFTAPGGAVVCTSATCGTGTTYGTLGNAPRGLLRGPGLDTVDLSLNKETRLPFLGEQGSLEFRAELFNILNHPNFNMPNGTVLSGKTTDFGPYSEAPSTSAGVISSTVTTSRQIQFALKVVF